MEYEGAIYHVTIRGNEKQAIFRDDNDRERFLDRLAEKVKDCHIRLYLFCMMNNHVHLVFETPEANLSRFMHDLQTAYTVYFNLRHERAGHLMQGRYNAKLVGGDEYLLKLSRYVHLNPVFTVSARKLSLKERINILRRYQWSSYLSYTGKARKFEFVEYGPMLSLTNARKARQQREYGKYVEAGLSEEDEELSKIFKESRLSIGGEEFRRRIWDLHLDLLDGHKRKEDVSFRKAGRRVLSEEILEAVSLEFGVEHSEIFRRQRGGYVRPVAAKMLSRYGGLTQREIAGILKLGTGAAVSLQIKQFEELLPSNRSLRKKIERIEHVLEEKK